MAQVLDTDVVVRGGQAPLPEPGTIFSGSYGETLEAAASGAVHGTIRATTAGAIRKAGGTVEHAPEASYPGGPLNERHVHVTEGAGPSVFSGFFPNPVPKQERVARKPTVGS